MHALLYFTLFINFITLIQIIWRRMLSLSSLMFLGWSVTKMPYVLNRSMRRIHLFFTYLLHFLLLLGYNLCYWNLGGMKIAHISEAPHHRNLPEWWVFLFFSASWRFFCCLIPLFDILPCCCFNVVSPFWGIASPCLLVLSFPFLGFSGAFSWIFLTLYSYSGAYENDWLSSSFYLS